MTRLQHILFVEDDPDIRLLASLALSDVGGFTLNEAENGKQALAYLSNHRPDLVLMDIMMPEMDGLTALANMKQDANLQDIPVIFMTARVQPDEIKNYITAGALGVIIKPFDPMTLTDEVNALWVTQK
jgi:CheY-like chemotaxis protein